MIALACKYKAIKSCTVFRYRDAVSNICLYKYDYVAFSLTVYMMRILYLLDGELTDFLNLVFCFQFDSCLQRDRCSHWAVTAFLGSSTRSVRHPAVLHRSTQPLACFPPPVFVPSPGPAVQFFAS